MSQEQKEAKVPKILVITDIGRDIDDMLALCLLKGYEDMGKCQLVGVVATGGNGRKRGAITRGVLRKLGWQVLPKIIQNQTCMCHGIFAGKILVWRRRNNRSIKGCRTAHAHCMLARKCESFVWLLIFTHAYTHTHTLICTDTFCLLLCLTRAYSRTNTPTRSSNAHSYARTHAHTHTLSLSHTHTHTHTHHRTTYPSLPAPRQAEKSSTHHHGHHSKTKLAWKQERHRIS
jgi:hypothetical protein